MARMHSRAKGRSGSTKPSENKKTTWIRYKPKEIEILTTKLAKEGKSTSEIGLILRDTYGIPSVKIICEKSISGVLKESNLLPKIPEDLGFLMKRALKITKHIENNNQDKTAKRGLTLTESKINRLVKYYKKSGKLSKDWKYDRNNIQINF
jgi:small subunit ribosomal protein S15